MVWQQTFLFATEPSDSVAAAASAKKRVGARGAKKSAVAAVSVDPAAKSSAVKSSVIQAAAAVPDTVAQASDVAPLARIDQLRRLVRRLESREAAVEGEQPVVFSAGGPPLDSLLPHGGLRPGTLVEWVCGAGRSGATLLAMIAAAEILRHEASGGRPLVVVDGLGGEGESFYPPAAISLGIPADSMIVVRKRRGHTRGDLVWAIDQALRSGAVAAVYAEIGDWLDPADARRLQLAAESGGAVGLLVRPADSPASGSRSIGGPGTRSTAARMLGGTAARTTAVRRPAVRSSFADVRWAVSSLPGHGGRRLRVELSRCRGGVTGGSREIEIGVAADRLAGGMARSVIDTGASVVIREVRQPEVAIRHAGKPVGGTSDAAATVAGDLVGRLADPAVAARRDQRARDQRARDQRARDQRRHAG